MVAILLKRLPHGEGLPLPYYAHPGDAGADVHAALVQDITLHPGQCEAIPSGFEVCIPYGYEAQVRTRSGLAKNHRILVANSPGTVDAPYRGELKVLLLNAGNAVFTITRGMRVAQLVVSPVVTAEWREVEALPPSPRGAAGFGSSGLK